MKKEDKQIVIEELKSKLDETKNFYLADIAGLDAEQTSDLRRKCFEKDIKLLVVKNTLLKLALDKSEKEVDEIYDVLKGSTSVMFTEVGNAPAKLIQEFRKKGEKPLVKAAFVEESVYIGDEHLIALASLKSKEELIGDIIMLLQSPAKNVLSSLQSSGNILAGIVKTLSEKE